MLSSDSRLPSAKFETTLALKSILPATELVPGGTCGRFFTLFYCEVVRLGTN